MRTKGLRRNLRTALAGSLVFGGLTTISLAATSALTEGTSSASTESLFTSSGTGFVTYPTVPVIPSDLCFVEVPVVGGAGGGNDGGGGGSTIARIPVTPGDQLAVEVGGAGGTSGGTRRHRRRQRRGRRRRWRQLRWWWWCVGRVVFGRTSGCGRRRRRP